MGEHGYLAADANVFEPASVCRARNEDAELERQSERSLPAIQRQLLYLRVAAVAGVACVVTEPVLAACMRFVFVYAVRWARGDEVDHSLFIAHARATFVLAGHCLAESVAASVSFTIGYALEDGLFDLSVLACTAVATVVAPPRVAIGSS